MINSYYTGSNTSSKEWKINLSFSGLCKFLHQGRRGMKYHWKKSISLSINQATVIYWVVTHLFVTVISCIASGCDKWSGLSFGKEGDFLAVLPLGCQSGGWHICSHVKWKSVDSWEAWRRDYEPQPVWEATAKEYILEILPKWSPSQVLNTCVTSRTCTMLSRGARMILFPRQLKDKQEGCKQKSWKSC